MSFSRLPVDGALPRAWFCHTGCWFNPRLLQSACCNIFGHDTEHQLSPDAFTECQYWSCIIYPLHIYYKYYCFKYQHDDFYHRILLHEAMIMCTCCAAKPQCSWWIWLKNKTFPGFMKVMKYYCTAQMSKAFWLILCFHMFIRVLLNICTRAKRKLLTWEGRRWSCWGGSQREKQSGPWMQ